MLAVFGCIAGVGQIKSASPACTLSEIEKSCVICILHDVAAGQGGACVYGIHVRSLADVVLGYHHGATKGSTVHMLSHDAPRLWARQHTLQSTESVECQQ